MTATSEIINALKEKNKPQPYDTQATVTRIEGNTAWVAIPGGVDETPVQRTINAKTGDVVQVRVSGGTAFLVGNGTAPPTDDTRAVMAEQTAENAFKSALAASEAADQAIASAAIAAEAAEAAETSATTAKQAADRSLAQLTIVEDVAGTLSWIAENGEYVLTTDTSVVEGTVYFVYDSTAEDYSPVIDPDPEANPSEEGWYVLDISDSQSEFIMKHLAVTSRGLWVLPDGIGTASDPQYGVNYKTLLADDGMYVYNGIGELVAKYSTAVQIGKEYGARMEISSKAISGYNSENIKYFDVDMSSGAHTETVTRDESVTKTIRATNVEQEVARVLVPITGGQSGDTFTVYEVFPIESGGPGIPSADLYSRNISSITVTSHSNCYANVIPGSGSPRVQVYFNVNGVTWTIGTDQTIEASLTINGTIAFRFVLEYDATAETFTKAVFVTDSANQSLAISVALRNRLSYTAVETEPAFTLGTRKSGTSNGFYSAVIGEECEASDDHAVAFGKFNKYDSDYALMYGTGTSDSARANAIAVTRGGDIETALSTTAASGTVDGDLYAAITALGWESEVIV